MDISFPKTTPVYRSEESTLTFYALADGERIDCTISAQALKDHFGAASSDEDELRRAFEIGRAAIEGSAEQLLTSVGRKPVVLRSGYFRFDGGAPVFAHADGEPNAAGNGGSLHVEPPLPKPHAAQEQAHSGQGTQAGG